MRAHARIVAVAARGGTVLAELRGEAPLLPRVTGERGGPVAHVHLVGGAAGPLGGDELTLDVEVGPGASLVLRTVAATVALPGRGASTTTLRASVAAGGRLAWLPEPVVAAAGCDHTQLWSVELEPGAELVWREELVAGRYGEEPGHLRQEARLRRAGATVLAQDQVLDAAMLAPDRTLGNLVVVAGEARAGLERATGDDSAARMPLGHGVWLCTAVAPDVPTLRRRLAQLSPAGWLD